MAEGARAYPPYNGDQSQSPYPFSPRQPNKSFLLLFLKKEDLAYPS
jgi:hypothetical protein